MNIYSQECQVTAVASGKKMPADVLSFREKQSLSVALNRSVKLTMTWNGRCFEGRSAGLDFESPGPEIVRV